MFRTSKCSSSGRLVHAVLRYFFHAEFIIKGYINCISIKYKVQGVQLKSGPILMWVIYLLRFTTCYITQLTCVYSKCWKWCPFVSVRLSTRFAMFLATFLSGLLFEPVSWNFLIIFAIALFTGACLLNFSKKLCLRWAQYIVFK